MNRRRFSSTAAGFLLAALSASGQAQDGLDFRTYLSLERGMTEGEVRAVAGKPDFVAHQGYAPETTMLVYGADNPPPAERLALIVRTYSYLATPAEPYTTTITFIGGRVYEIERNRKF